MKPLSQQGSVVGFTCGVSGPGRHQPDSFAAELDLKLVAGLEVDQGGVGVAHHQVAIELHLGFETQLAARLALAVTAAPGAKGGALGFQ